MSAVTSSPLPLSVKWIPTLPQTSKEVRKKGEWEGETRGGVGEYQGVDIRGYTGRTGEDNKEKESYSMNNKKKKNRGWTRATELKPERGARKIDKGGKKGTKVQEEDWK